MDIDGLEDKEKLFLYFFYIAQFKANRAFKNENQLKKDFNNFIESSNIEVNISNSTIGQGTFRNILRKLNSLIEYGDGMIKLAQSVLDFSETIEESILIEQKEKIFQYFDLDTSEFFISELDEEKKDLLPIPDLNSPYSGKMFYWYYQTDEFLDSFNKTFGSFFKDPWQKSLGLIIGPSNSGKTSFIRFLKALNESNFTKNNWTIKISSALRLNNNIKLKYTDEIVSLRTFDTWLVKLISQTPKNIGYSDLTQKTNLSDFSIPVKLEVINEILNRLHSKFVLLIDQAEEFIENTTSNVNDCEIFVTEIAEKLKTIPNISLILIISDEFKPKLELILQKAGVLNEMHLVTFIFEKLDLSLIDIIIPSLRTSGIENSTLQFRPIIINDSAIPNIKQAISEGKYFSGTSLNILLNKLVLQYNNQSSLEIKVPDFSVEGYKAILDEWIYQSLESRIHAQPATEEYLEYLLLKEMYTYSINKIVFVPLTQIERWYMHQKTLSISENVPPLEKLLKSLTKDGLIQIDESHQNYRIKHQSILNKLDKYLKPEEKTLIYLENQWLLEIKLSRIPEQNIFKNIFENSILLSKLYEDEMNRKKLAEGLLYHHKKVDITNQKEEIVFKLFSEILYQNIEKDTVISYLNDLYTDYNQRKKDFLLNFYNKPDHKNELLAFNWSKLYYSSKQEDLINLLEQIKKINPSLSSSIIALISSFIYDKIPNISKSDFLFLNTLSKSFNEMSKQIERLSWNKFQDSSLDTIQEILDSLNSIQNDIIDSYKKDKEQYKQIPSEEENLIKYSYGYQFSKKYLETIRWNTLPWENYSLDFITSIFKNFNQYLEYPKVIMEFHWSKLLQDKWNKNPKEVITFIDNNLTFRRLYFNNWPQERCFPELKDFINTNNLGLMNYFLWKISDFTYNRAKMFEFIEQNDFNIENLSPILHNNYYPKLYDFKMLIKEFHLKKFETFQPFLEKLMQENQYLNYYHKILCSLFNDVEQIPIISSINMLTFENANTFYSHSWSRSFFSLPSIIDVVASLSKIIRKNEPFTFINKLIQSIKVKTGDWNSLFDIHSYMDSLNDYFPGLGSYYYYNQTGEHQIKNLNQFKSMIELIHFKGLFLLFEELITTPAFRDLLDVFIEHTNFLDSLLCDQALNILAVSMNDHITYLDIMNYKRLRGNIFNDNDNNYVFEGPYNSLANNFIQLLKAQHISTEKIFIKFKSHGLLLEIQQNKSIIEYNKHILMDLVIKIIKNNYQSLNNSEKIWFEIFGLNLDTTNHLTGLPINQNTFEKLVNTYSETFLKQLPWDILLVNFTDQEYEQIYKILFQHGFWILLQDPELNLSLFKGFLADYQRWEQHILNYCCDMLEFLGEIIFYAEYILDTEIKNEWIQISLSEFENVIWYEVLYTHDNSQFELRHLLGFWENPQYIDPYDKIGAKILDELCTNSELFLKYNHALYDIKRIGECIKKGISRNKVLFEPLSNKFCNKLANNPINITNEKTTIPEIINFLKNFFLSEECMQIFIEKNQLFNQFLEIIKNISENEAPVGFIEQLLQFYSALKDPELSRYINPKHYLKELIERINLSNVFIKRNFYKLFEFQKNNVDQTTYNEFIELIIQSNAFKNINWQKVVKDDDYNSLLITNFLKELIKAPKQIIIDILENRSFWNIQWIKWLKDQLIYINKDLIVFFNIVVEYKDNEFVKIFIQSQDFHSLPWEFCMKQITLSNQKLTNTPLIEEELKKIVNNCDKFFRVTLLES